MIRSTVMFRGMAMLYGSRLMTYAVLLCVKGFAHNENMEPYKSDEFLQLRSLWSLFMFKVLCTLYYVGC